MNSKLSNILENKIKVLNGLLKTQLFFDQKVIKNIKKLVKNMKKATRNRMLKQHIRKIDRYIQKSLYNTFYDLIIYNVPVYVIMKLNHKSEKLNESHISNTIMDQTGAFPESVFKIAKNAYLVCSHHHIEHHQIQIYNKLNDKYMGNSSKPIFVDIIKNRDKLSLDKSIKVHLYINLFKYIYSAIVFILIIIVTYELMFYAERLLQMLYNNSSTKRWLEVLYNSSNTEKCLEVLYNSSIECYNNNTVWYNKF